MRCQFCHQRNHCNQNHDEFRRSRTDERVAENILTERYESEEKHFRPYVINDGSLEFLQTPTHEQRVFSHHG